MLRLANLRSIPVWFNVISYLASPQPGCKSADSTCTLQLLRGCGWRRFGSTLGSVCLRLSRNFPAAGTLLLDSTNFNAERGFVMSQPGNNHKINYLEFTSTDIERSKQFYSTVFGWSFVDYGPDYISFSAAGAGIDGGFMRGESKPGSPLVVLYACDLKAAEQAIVAAGGSITVPVFEFPGGSRFHFSDGAGNVLAVWSE